MNKTSALKVEQVDIELIEDDGTRLRRAVNEDTVSRLVQSMAEIGLKTPIVVRYFPHRASETHGTDDSFVLVVGGHRVEAGRRLGWRSIDAFVLDDAADDRDVRLWEIAENLDRSELTQLERKEHIAEWVRLTDEKRSKAQVAPLKRANGRPDQGINAAVRELGIDRTEAQRAAKVAALDPEAKETARILRLDDNQAALLKAARETNPRDQVASLQLQAELAERRKKNKPEDQLREDIATDEFADWIMGNMGLDDLPRIVEWLEVVKPKNVIAALRRLTKDPPPVMDRRYG